METPIIQKPVTLKSVFWKKIVTWCDTHSTVEIVFQLCKILLAFQFFIMTGQVIPSLIFLFFLVRIKWVLEKARLFAIKTIEETRAVVSSFSGEKPLSDEQDNITFELLAQYLISKRNFKVKEVREEFGLTSNEYYELVDILDRKHILERGDNNSRILLSHLKNEHDILSLLYEPEVSSFIIKSIYKENPIS